VVDEKGKVLGYKNLTELKHQLAPIMLRRSRASVQQQLPARSTKIIRITPTEEQLEIHSGHSRIIKTIINKPYLSEMDLLRLQKALLMCRMSADSSYLVDKQAPGYSSKLEILKELLGNLIVETDRKIILFSEWTTMLDLIEPILQQLNISRVRLDGKVPTKKRQQLVNQFQTDANCQLFMATNAGATGLNLQAANTIVNVDLPWNPALLEQRIARAHRMGQKRPVQVYILVTTDTLEENLLATLSAKKELAMATLDPDTNIDSVDLQSGIDELKRRLEVLLGNVPDASLDASMLSETKATVRQQRVTDASSTLLSAVFGFINEILPEGDSEKQTQLADQLTTQLEQNLTPAEDGSFELKLKLPDQQSLQQISATLAKIILAGQRV
jgi:SNF2 family DNA or RNA helicase